MSVGIVEAVLGGGEKDKKKPDLKQRKFLGERSSRWWVFRVSPLWRKNLGARAGLAANCA